jgi:hypothetical protein
VGFSLDAAFFTHFPNRTKRYKISPADPLNFEVTPRRLGAKGCGGDFPSKEEFTRFLEREREVGIDRVEKHFTSQRNGRPVTKSFSCDIKSDDQAVKFIRYNFWWKGCMALLSDLVTAVAQAEGMEEVTVGVFARHAREAGLISQAGRGRAAARMTVRDAVNLMIAVNACGLAKDVQYDVERFRRLPNTGVTDAAYPELIGKIFAPRRQFGEALEMLVEASAADEQGHLPLAIAMGETRSRQATSRLPDLGAARLQLEISFSRPKPEAEIAILAKSVHLLRAFGEQTVARAIFRRPERLNYGDRADRVTITDRTIDAVSEALRKIR